MKFSHCIYGNDDCNLCDRKPLKTSKHPQRTSFWKRILNIFLNPKFSKDSIEMFTNDK